MQDPDLAHLTGAEMHADHGKIGSFGPGGAFDPRLQAKSSMPSAPSMHPPTAPVDHAIERLQGEIQHAHASLEQLVGKLSGVLNQQAGIAETDPQPPPPGGSGVVSRVWECANQVASLRETIDVVMRASET